MRKKERLFITVFGFLLLAFFFLGIAKIPFFSPLTAAGQIVFSPVQHFFYGVFSSVGFVSDDTKKILSENRRLRQALVDQRNVERENKALKDQFQTTSILASKLLPAHIVGMPSFLPGVSEPEMFIINVGASNHIVVGQPVVEKESLLGRVTQVSPVLSQVTLLTNKSSSFTATIQDESVLGVVTGLGNGEMVLDNVLLSEKLSVGDTVVTRGDIGEDGKGFPPGLIVGKITSIEKKPSALFQRAKIQSLVDASSLTTVFVLQQ